MVTGRRRITTASDWHEYIGQVITQQQPVNLYADSRAPVYVEIEALRKRPLFVYASKFPGAHPAAPVTIEQGDVDGFTDLISKTDPKAKSVDVLIHSPGGSPEATERIVSLLRNRFDDVVFLVPHSAYSAATMLALSGNEIILHPSATLGPIDPQINGIPARAIQKGFARVRELLKDQGPEALPAYVPLIEKHSLEILEICDDALLLSKELARNWLLEFMFRGDVANLPKIEAAVDFFADYSEHKTHSRPLMFNKLAKLDLNITVAEDPLADLLREAYLVINGFLNVTTFVKVYENASGLTWGNQFQLVQQQMPAGAFTQPQ